jgi:uncharacterized protein
MQENQAKQDVLDQLLLDAVRNGENKKVIYSLFLGANIDAHTSTGISALMRAAYWGYEEVVITLLSRGASLSLTDKELNTVIFRAEQRKQKTIIDILKQHEFYNTKLLAAIKSGDTKMTERYIMLGGNVNLRTHLGVPAVVKASYWGQPKIVHLLLQNGADPKAKDKGDRDALYWAKRKNEKTIIRLIHIYSTAKVDSQGRTIFTEDPTINIINTEQQKKLNKSLLIAIGRKDTQTVARYLELGAEIIPNNTENNLSAIVRSEYWKTKK